MEEENNASNPYSTGAGGTHFERRVQAYFLVHLICGMPIPGLNYSIADWKFKVQARVHDVQTDDIVIEENDVCVLVAQIKHKVAYTVSDSQYSDSIKQIWNDFKNKKISDKKSTALLITGPMSQDNINHVRPIYEWAITSNSYADFISKFSTSKQKNEKLSSIRKIIEKAEGEKINDEDFLKFCKLFQIFSFDIDYESSKDLSVILGIIKDHLVHPTDENAKTVFNEIQIFLNPFNQAAGVITLNDLPESMISKFKTTFLLHSLDPWNSPQSVSGIFCGQNTFVEEVMKRFLEVREEDSGVKIVRLHGTGGIGKTYLARRYFTSPPKKYYLRMWFDGTTKETLMAGYRDFARDALSISDSLSDSSMLKKVKSFLNNMSERWLMIVDNLDDPGLENTFPTQNGDIFLTQQYAGSDQSVEVIRMSPHDASLLFRTRAGLLRDPSQQDAIDALNIRLGCLPLAIAQAAAYIKSARITVEEYLRYYLSLESRGELLSQDKLRNEHVSIQITWDIALDKIKEQQSAVNLMWYLSWLLPNKIPYSLLKELLGVRNNFAMTNILALLSDYSLIELNRLQKTMAVHRVLQDVLQEKQKTDSSHEKNISHLIAIFNKIFIYNPEKPDLLIENDLLLPHLIFLLEHAETHGMLDRVPSDLYYHMGLHCQHYRFDLDEAMQYFEMAEEFCEEQDVKKIRRQKARTLLKQAKAERNPKKKVMLFNRAEKLFEDNMQDDDLQSLCDYAEFLCERVEYFNNATLSIDEEGKLFVRHDKEKLLRDREKTEGNVLKSINNLEKLYKGMPAKSPFNDFQRSLMCRILYHFGTAYLKLKDYEQSERSFREALAHRREYLPDNELQTARVRHMLAKVLSMKKAVGGSLEEATRLSKEALNIKIDYYKKPHADITITLKLLGRIYEKRKKLEKALMCFLQSKKYEEDVGSVSNNTLYKLAKLYFEIGKREESLKIIEEYYRDDNDVPKKIKKLKNTILGTTELSFDKEDIQDEEISDYESSPVEATLRSTDGLVKLSEDDGEKPYKRHKITGELLSPFSQSRQNPNGFFPDSNASSQRKKRKVDKFADREEQKGEEAKKNFSLRSLLPNLLATRRRANHESTVDLGLQNRESNGDSDSLLPIARSATPISAAEKVAKNSIKSNVYQKLSYAIEEEWDKKDMEKAIKASLRENEKLQELRAVLLSQATAFGFTVKEMERDGNCFFHGAFDQLQEIGYPNSKDFTAEYLRQCITQHLIDYSHLYKDSIDDDIDEFIKKISQAGEWADGVIIQALARILNLTIVLIRSDAGNPTVFRRGNPLGVLYLGYEVGLHFQSLISTKETRPEKNIKDFIERAEIDDFGEPMKLPENLSFQIKEQPETNGLAEIGIFSSSVKSTNKKEVYPVRGSSLSKSTLSGSASSSFLESQSCNILDPTSHDHAKNSAVKKFIGASDGKSELNFEQWLSRDSMAVLLPLIVQKGNTDAMTFCALDGGTGVAAYSSQMRKAVQEARKAGKSLFVISKEPVNFPSQHYVLTIFHKEKIYFIDPTGQIRNGFCNEFKALIDFFDMQSMPLLASKSKLQNDPNGLVSCGVICLALCEFFAQDKNLKKLEEIESKFEDRKSLHDESDEKDTYFMYNEFWLGTIFPSLVPPEAKNYRSSIVAYRAKFYTLLDELGEPQIEELRESDRELLELIQKADISRDDVNRRNGSGFN